MEAIKSGLIPVYDEPESPPKHSSNSNLEPVDDQEDSEPCTFFFYGTLMDPEVLMVVAMLDDWPQLQDAWIDGFEMKTWNGRYPTLLPTNSNPSRIQGKAWRATTMDQCLRLQRYETSAYDVADCHINMGNKEPVKGLSFKWARDPTSSELVEGSFDLEHWQKTHKTPLF